MPENTERVPVVLDNGTRIFIEATAFGGEEEVGIVNLQFSDVTQALEGIASALATTLVKVKPQKAVVELGIEIALESGKLTAMLVKGSGKANLKVTLEWSDLAERNSTSAYLPRRSRRNPARE